MVDVFISYKREDHARVDRLAGLLGEFGVNVWHDAALGAGADWQAQIEDIARSARCVVVCWTAGCEQSEWVRREFDIGRERGVLAPVKFAPCEIPAEFSEFHFADLSDWVDGGDHKGMRQLFDGLDRHLNRGLPAKLDERAGGQNPEVVSRLRALLIDTARSFRPPISYGQAYRAVARSWARGHKTSFEALYGALDAIAEQNRSRREPPLCALVVTNDGLPGRGYFQKHCFLADGASAEARALHAAQLRHVYAYPWPNDPVAPSAQP